MGSLRVWEELKSLPFLSDDAAFKRIAILVVRAAMTMQTINPIGVFWGAVIKIKIWLNHTVQHLKEQKKNIGWSIKGEFSA